MSVVSSGPPRQRVPCLLPTLSTSCPHLPMIPICRLYSYSRIRLRVFVPSPDLLTHPSLLTKFWSRHLPLVHDPSVTADYRLEHRLPEKEIPAVEKEQRPRDSTGGLRTIRSLTDVEWKKVRDVQRGGSRDL